MRCIVDVEAPCHRPAPAPDVRARRTLERSTASSSGTGAPARRHRQRGFSPPGPGLGARPRPVGPHALHAAPAGDLPRRIRRSSRAHSAHSHTVGTHPELPDGRGADPTPTTVLSKGQTTMGPFYTSSRFPSLGRHTRHRTGTASPRISAPPSPRPPQRRPNAAHRFASLNGNDSVSIFFAAREARSGPTWGASR